MLINTSKIYAINLKKIELQLSSPFFLFSKFLFNFLFPMEKWDEIIFKQK